MRLRLSSVRLRLVALYAALFAVTATVLLITVNLLLERVFQHKVDAFIGKSIIRSGPPGVSAPPPGPGLPRVVAGSSANPILSLRDSVLDYQWTVTWIAVAVLAVIGAAAGWWVSGRVLRPVNRMLERLAHAAEVQRRFAADASHELRTPLAIQRAAIEIGLADPSPEQLARMRRELLEANERTERLVEGLLILAQGERASDRREPLDLSELARDAVEQHRSAAASAAVQLEVSLARTLPGDGDPVLLTRLVANLIDNGIRYNLREGGRVEVRASAGALLVSNTGPVVPADRVPELFEPFRRLHQDRTGPASGAGLGLSIVAAIADAHGLRLDASANAEGGLSISVGI